MDAILLISIFIALMIGVPYLVHTYLYSDEYSIKKKVLHYSLSSIILGIAATLIIISSVTIYTEQTVNQEIQKTEYATKWKEKHKISEYQNKPVYNIPTRDTAEIPYYDDEAIYKDTYFMLQTNNQLFELDYELIDNMKKYYNMTETNVLTPVYNQNGEPVFL